MAHTLRPDSRRYAVWNRSGEADKGQCRCVLVLPALPPSWRQVRITLDDSRREPASTSSVSRGTADPA